jgi:hypothetical protein
MSVLRKLERDRLAAELVSVDRLLASLTADDIVTRFDLEDRREELQATIDASSGELPTAASAPVVASVGIEAEFGGTAVSKFQDLVAKLMVSDSGLGQRGPVPNKSAAAMHITNVVRGSFGFLMQELQPQTQLVPSGLQVAVTGASRLIAAFSSSNEQQFQDAAADVDQRALATAGDFFGYLRQNSATFRLVAGEQDRSFTSAEIAVAAERALSTIVDEFDRDITGYLSGTLPESHAFEFKGDDGITYSGRVNKDIPDHELVSWNISYLNLPLSAKLRVRRVHRNGEVVKETYALTGISPPTELQQVEQRR